MTEFSVNKETLVAKELENSYLCVVPGTKRKMMTMFEKGNVIREDDKTLYFQYPEDADIPVWEEPPSDEDIKTYLKNPAESESWIPLEANELYDGWYEFREYASPEEKKAAEQKRQETIQNQKRQKQDMEKKPKEQAAKQSVNRNQEKAAKQEQTAKPVDMQKYSKEQFREIRKGLRQHVDVKVYQSVQFNAKQMKQLRLSLKDHINVSSWASPYVPADKMKELRTGIKKGIQFGPDKIDHRLYDAAQIREIRLGFEKGVMVKEYLNPVLSAEQMHELRIGLQLGLDISRYNDPSFSVDQMRILKRDMIMDNIREIIERWLEKIRDAIDMVAGRAVERMVADMEHREMRSPEQIKIDTMQDVVQEIKYLLVESELVPASAYDDQEFEFKIKEQLDELVNHLAEPEEALKDEIQSVTENICDVQSSKEPETTLEERIEQAADKVFEDIQQMEEVMEVETFEMQM